MLPKQEIFCNLIFPELEIIQLLLFMQNIISTRLPSQEMFEMTN